MGCFTLFSFSFIWLALQNQLGWVAIRNVLCSHHQEQFVCTSEEEHPPLIKLAFSFFQPMHSTSQAGVSSNTLQFLLKFSQHFSSSNLHLKTLQKDFSGSNHWTSFCLSDTVWKSKIVKIVKKNWKLMTDWAVLDT